MRKKIYILRDVVFFLLRETLREFAHNFYIQRTWNYFSVYYFFLYLKVIAEMHHYISFHFNHLSENTKKIK